MRLDFAKLHGLGNDFVFVDDRAHSIELTDAQVSHLCDRHTGIGADGVILVRSSPRAECAAYVHYINADGSLAQMCGNGVRCFAKYLVDRGIVPSDAKRLVADTLSGPKPLDFETDDDGRLVQATVDMGRPVLEPSAVPVAAEANARTAQGSSFVRELPVASPWGTFSFTCVSMGNPHAICFLDDMDAVSDDLFADPSGKSLASLDVPRLGAFFEPHALFPEKTNVEFAVAGEDGIDLRVYERGCGETLACGTGACATQAAAFLTGRAGREGAVRLPGGALHIAWSDNGHVFMTGPAEQSFEGTIDLSR